MKTFSCPQCGGSLKSEQIKGSTVECPYCHSAVIVPEELRPTPRAPIPAFQASHHPVPKTSSSPAAVILISTLVIVAIVGGAILIGGIAYFRKAKTGVSGSRRNVPSTSPSTLKGPATLTLLFGEQGTGTGSLTDPTNVAVDGAGNIYVSERKTLRIQRFDSTGKFQRLWMIPSETQYYDKRKDGGPDKLLADLAGNVYVLYQRVILKYNGNSGELLTTIHDEGRDTIIDVALQPDDGLLLVVFRMETNKHDLVWVDAKGQISKRIVGFLQNATDDHIVFFAVHPAVDGLGNIFVLHDPEVFKFTPDGKYVNKFGGKGDEPGQLNMATEIAIDKRGRIFVDGFKGLQIFAADGRYLDVIDFRFSARAMAFDSKNDLYLIGQSYIPGDTYNKYKVAKLKLNN